MLPRRLGGDTQPIPESGILWVRLGEFAIELPYRCPVFLLVGCIGIGGGVVCLGPTVNGKTRNEKQGQRGTKRLAAMTSHELRPIVFFFCGNCCPPTLQHSDQR